MTRDGLPEAAAEPTLIPCLLVCLNDGRYTIPLEAVLRIVKPPEIFPMPDTPEFVLGVANYSGEVLPVVDLKRVLRVPSPGDETARKLVVCRHQHVKVGFLVDDVIDAFDVDRARVKADTARVREGEFISGEFVTERDAVAMIDVAKIITTHQAPA